MIKKLIARFYLWMNDVCTKHGVQKEWRGYDPEASYMACPECEKEADERREKRFKWAMDVLDI
jgi:hypothetical protein